MPEGQHGHQNRPENNTSSLTSQLLPYEVVMRNLQCKVALVAITGSPTIKTIQTFSRDVRSYLALAQKDEKQLVLIVDFSSAKLEAITQLLSGLITMISSHLVVIESQIMLQLLIVPQDDPEFHDLIAVFQTDNEVRRGNTDLAAGGILKMHSLQEAVDFLKSFGDPKSDEG